MFKGCFYNEKHTPQLVFLMFFHSKHLLNDAFLIPLHISPSAPHAFLFALYPLFLEKPLHWTNAHVDDVHHLLHFCYYPTATPYYVIAI